MEGTVTPKFVRFDGEYYRGELFDYKRQLRIGENVFLTLEDAKAAARSRIPSMISKLEDELAMYKEALRQATDDNAPEGDPSGASQ